MSLIFSFMTQNDFSFAAEMILTNSCCLTADEDFKSSDALNFSVLRNKLVSSCGHVDQKNIFRSIKTKCFKHQKSHDWDEARNTEQIWVKLFELWPQLVACCIFQTPCLIVKVFPSVWINVSESETWIIINSSWSQIMTRFEMFPDES